MSDEDESGAAAPRDFIRAMIDADLASGKVKRVVTRFPPEPNGFLHIGHAKAICLNFGLAQEYPGAQCNLRFDDTNPETEDPAYVASIQHDIRWLGFDWGENLFFASDYYPRLYQDAERLIEMGKAYVCDLSEDEFRECRGTVTAPGRPSPFRERPPTESLDLLHRMQAGEFDEGSRVLRAKVDMASPNMKMRDPPVYRIKKAHHYRTGDAWRVYPMYDFAHPLSDAYEGITHSLCTLEFENNRELYDWYLDTLGYAPRPYQTEMARLNLNYLVMSKRFLLQLVEERRVSGWDDPRMPTLAGLRRRGVRPEAIRRFCQDVGVARAVSTVDMGQLEHAIRDDLNQEAPRRLAVLRPLPVEITNYPEGEGEELEASDWPADVPREGTRMVPFGRHLFLERDDFAEDPPPGWHRLSPGAEVRLRYAYFLRCDEVLRGPDGAVTGLRCSYDPETKGGNAPDGRKVKGTLHWVSAAHALEAEVRLYDRLFQVETPGAANQGDFLADMNPESLEVIPGARLEPGLAAAGPGERFQFERQGFFFVDPEDSKPGKPVFNRTVGLKDRWAKLRFAQLAPTAAPSASLFTSPSSSPSATSSPRDYEAGLAGDSLDWFRARRAGGLSDEAARALVDNAALRSLFDGLAEDDPRAPAIATLLVNDVARALKEASRDMAPFAGAAVAELHDLLAAGTISSAIAKKVLAEMVASGEAPAAIVEARGWSEIADEDQLGGLVDEVLAAHPDNVARYRQGKTGLLGFFTGQVMKRSGGRAAPRLVQELLEKRLGSA